MNLVFLLLDSLFDYNSAIFIKKLESDIFIILKLTTYIYNKIVYLFNTLNDFSDKLTI